MLPCPLYSLGEKPEVVLLHRRRIALDFPPDAQPTGPLVQLFDVECAGWTAVCDREALSREEKRALEERERKRRQERRKPRAGAAGVDAGEPAPPPQKPEPKSKGPKISEGVQFLPRFHGVLRIAADRRSDRFVLLGVCDHAGGPNRVLWRVEVPPEESADFRWLPQGADVVAVNAVDSSPLGRALCGTPVRELVVLELPDAAAADLLAHFLHARSFRRYRAALRDARRLCAVRSVDLPPREEDHLRGRVLTAIVLQSPSISFILF
ncbi:hypothetical protein M3Y99_00976700 [Aphelenchoides fujianensis]|nr:hypothetical protein M3Y99_00976700 [Aphelenchoides fujianensis]